MLGTYFKNQNKAGKTLLILILFFSGLAMAQLITFRIPPNPLRDYGSLYGLIVVLYVLFRFRDREVVSYLTIIIPSLVMWFFFYLNVGLGLIEGVFTMLFGMLFMLVAAGYVFMFLTPSILMTLHTIVILSIGNRIDNLELILLVMWFLNIIISGVYYHFYRVNELAEYKLESQVNYEKIVHLSKVNEQLRLLLGHGIIIGYISNIEKFSDYVFNLTVVSEDNHFPVEAAYADIKGLKKNDLVIANGIWETRWLKQCKTNQVYLVAEKIVRLDVQSHQGASGTDSLMLIKLFINSVVDD